MIDAVSQRLVELPQQQSSIKQTGNSNVAGAQTTQATQAVSGITTPQAAQVVPLVPISRQRLATYEHWEKLQSGQRKLHQLELSGEGIKQLLKMLETMQKQLAQVKPRKSVMEKLQDRLHDWQEKNSDRFGVDHRLKLQEEEKKKSPRWFKINSVDLLAPRQHDEKLQVKFKDKKKSITLQGGANRATLRQQLEDGMKPLGVGILPGEPLRFAVADEDWKHVKKGLIIEGQGQRLPAGEGRPLKLTEQFHKQDPRSWQTLDNSDQLQQVSAAINRLSKEQERLSGQVEQLMQELVGKDFDVNFAALEQQLTALKQQLQPQTYGQQMSGLMAQANLSRSQSTALLSE